MRQSAERICDAIRQGDVGRECVAIGGRQESQGVDLAHALSPGNRRLLTETAVMNRLDTE